jgi:ATP-dependent Clp protease adaptor protein ClpS
MSTATDTITKIQLKEPELWDVIIYNDDKTPMDFVTGILEEIFHKNSKEAVQLMLNIHHNGSAVAGTYVYEIAEQKGFEATNVSRQNGYPLQIKLDNH